VLRADELRDLATEPLCKGRRRAARRHGDGDRALAVDSRQDERAELGNVGHVAEEPAPLGVGEDAPVHVLAGGCRDDEKLPVEVRALVPARKPAHGELPDFGRGLRGDDRDLCAALEEPAGLLEPDGPGADDEARAALEVDASHVVALRGH
jgi:hypothetical protein